MAAMSMANSMMTNLSSFDIHSEGGVEEVTLFDDSFKLSYDTVAVNEDDDGTTNAQRHHPHPLRIRLPIAT